MTVDGVPHEVIGVLPQSFRFLRQEADVLLPLQPNRAISFVGPLGENGIARLRPNVTIEDASADIERMIPILTSTFPPVPGMDMRAVQNLRLHPDLRYLKEAIVGDLRNVLSVLMGTIAMLLLMACANVANLQLVRTESRSHEFAVQAALGASRSRIALELFVENTLVALIGGALGLGLASAALPALLRMAAGHLPGALEIRIGWPVILFTVAVSIVSGLLFGLAAARQTRAAGSLFGTRRIRALTEREPRIAEDPQRIGGRAGGAGARAVGRRRPDDPDVSIPEKGGCRLPPLCENTNGGHLHSTRCRHETSSVAVRKFNDIQDRLAAVAGVDVVGFASRVPLGNKGPSAGFFVENKTPAGVAPPQQEFRYVSPDFFRTIGTRLVAGRDFNWTDHHEPRRVAIGFRGDGSPRVGIGVGSDRQANPHDVGRTVA